MKIDATKGHYRSPHDLKKVQTVVRKKVKHPLCACAGKPNFWLTRPFVGIPKKEVHTYVSHVFLPFSLYSPFWLLMAKGHFQSSKMLILHHNGSNMTPTSANTKLMIFRLDGELALRELYAMCSGCIGMTTRMEAWGL